MDRKEMNKMDEYERNCMYELQSMSCGEIPHRMKRFNFLWDLKCTLELQGKY